MRSGGGSGSASGATAPLATYGFGYLAGALSLLALPGGPGVEPWLLVLAVLPLAAPLGSWLLPRTLLGGLALVYLGGVPAQASAALLVLVDPAILFLPLRPAAAVAVTALWGLATLAWFYGTATLLFRAPAPVRARRFPQPAPSTKPKSERF